MCDADGEIHRDRDGGRAGKGSESGAFTVCELANGLVQQDLVVEGYENGDENARDY